MKIAHFLSQTHLTGAEVYALGLIEKSLEANHEVIIISGTFFFTTKAKYIKLDLFKNAFYHRLWQIIYLVYLLKKEKVQIIHAHSRASAKVAFWVSFFLRIPFVVTVHGIWKKRLKDKIINVFGNHTIAICENVRDHLINERKLLSKNVSLIRNGFKSVSTFSLKPKSDIPVVSIIGRLTGPKGQIISILIKKIIDLKIEIRLIGGPSLTQDLLPYKNKIKYFGFVKDVPSYIIQSDLVICSGRVAIESLLYQKPVIAIGEALGLGLITKDNITTAKATNFGDITYTNPQYNWDKIISDIKYIINNDITFTPIEKSLLNDYDLNEVSLKINALYLKLASAFFST